MRKIILFILAITVMVLSGCSINETPSQTAEADKEKTVISSQSELRPGTSDRTLAAPEDFPAPYDYGSGIHMEFGSNMYYKRLPGPIGNETVLHTGPDTAKIQALYLWEENNMPSQTEFTEGMDGYFDDYDFRPYLTAIPVREGVKAKGAVVLMAGGAYAFRANYTDTLPTAAHLRELGFQTFIVDYRLQPYTPQEGALDVARTVRFIRKNADAYGIEPENIAVMGYSAGGIQAGEFLLHFDGDVNGTILDSEYIPDELDEIPACASADAMIYSFYGRLSVASLDAEELRSGDLPPTFYCYGTEDPFYRSFEAQYELMEDVGIQTKRIVLDDWPHGFGGDGGWVEDYAKWLEEVFAGIRDEHILTATGETKLFTLQSTVGQIMDNPAFEDFGRLLFPVDRAVSEDMTIGELSSNDVYIWYSNIQPEKTVEIVNDLKSRAERGEQIFHGIYTEDEIHGDASKADTGLFYFQGTPGEKFAVLNAGGGFAYVGAMHDSFPHALELGRKGYNAFALIYRPDYAYEDLAQALSYIHDNAEELGVDSEGYSLWGGSAGARMAATLGNAEYLAQLTGRADIPQAAVVIVQYTGYTEVSAHDAPTYACVGTNDGIANWRTMKLRLEALKELGIPTEFHAYEGLGHGFGLGIGTNAEGWIDRAVDFWEQQSGIEMQEDFSIK